LVGADNGRRPSLFRIKNVDFKAGIDLARLALYPGERIRTPAMLLLFYNGDWIRGQNYLRRLLLTHFSPFSNDEKIHLPISASPHPVVNFESTTSANVIEGIKQISGNNLPVDAWWIDGKFGQALKYQLTGRCHLPNVPKNEENHSLEANNIIQ